MEGNAIVEQARGHTKKMSNDSGKRMTLILVLTAFFLATRSSELWNNGYRNVAYLCYPEASFVNVSTRDPLGTPNAQASKTTPCLAFAPSFSVKDSERHFGSNQICWIKPYDLPE